MTAKEFKLWLDHFSASFPEVHEWLVKAGEATIAAWQRVLSQLELIDAKSAVDVLIDGKEPIPKAYERSEWPATVKRIAGRLFLQRSQAVERSMIPVADVKHSMREILACIRECVRQGMDKESTLLVIDKRFPIPDDMQPRVRCQTCGDSGWVDVWADQAVQMAIAGVNVKRYRGTMLCSCKSADRIQRHPDDLTGIPGAQPMRRFDPRKFCRWNDGDLGKLRDWIAERRRNHVKERPNYEPAFEQYQESF